MDPSIDEIRLLAEAALPTVVRDLYSDRLHGGFIHEQDGRRFSALSDPAGQRIELRLDGVPVVFCGKTNRVASELR